MKALCRVTGTALILSAIFLFLGGMADLSARAGELDALFDGGVGPLKVLEWDFSDYAGPFFAAAAHALLALVVFNLPARLAPPPPLEFKSGIEG